MGTVTWLVLGPCQGADGVAEVPDHSSSPTYSSRLLTCALKRPRFFSL
jgi:hypothetical protein